MCTDEDGDPFLERNEVGYIKRFKAMQAGQASPKVQGLIRFGENLSLR